MIQSALQAAASAPVLVMMLLKASIILALGWALHFALARANPRWRVLLWRGVAVAVVLVPMCLVLPALKWTVAQAPIPIAPAPALQPHAPPIPDAAATAAGPVSETGTQNTHRGLPDPAVALLLTWALGAVVLANRYAKGIRAVRRLRRDSIPADERRDVALRVSKTLATPVVCGIVNPAIIVPERMTAPDYARELPAILAHELAHIEGRDLVWMNLIEVLAIVLWFHPLVWRMHRAHGAACETVCDGRAAEQVGGADLYSRTLARIALELVEQPRVCAIPMATSDVRRRLDALGRGVASSPLKRRVVRPLMVCSLAFLFPFLALRPIQAETTTTLPIAPEKYFAEDSNGQKVFFLTYADATFAADQIYAELGVPERQIREKCFCMKRGEERRFHQLSFKLTRIEPAANGNKASAEFELKDGDKTWRASFKEEEKTELDGYRFDLQSVRHSKDMPNPEVYLAVRDLAEPPKFGRYDGVEINPMAQLNCLIVTAPKPEEFNEIKAIVTKLDKPAKIFEVRAKFLDSATTPPLDLLDEIGLEGLIITDKDGKSRKDYGAVYPVEPKHVAKVDELIKSGRLKLAAGPVARGLEGQPFNFSVESRAEGKSPEVVHAAAMMISSDGKNIMVKNLTVEENRHGQFRKTVSDLKLLPGSAILVKDTVSEGHYILLDIKLLPTD